MHAGEGISETQPVPSSVLTSSAYVLLLPPAVQDMIILVTRRRLLLVHDNSVGPSGTTRARLRHTYCVVEWEVEFGLVVRLEASLQGVHDDSGAARGRGAHMRRDGEEPVFEGMRMSLYCFPDVCPASSEPGVGAYKW